MSLFLCESDFGWITYTHERERGGVGREGVVYMKKGIAKNKERSINAHVHTKTCWTADKRISLQTTMELYVISHYIMHSDNLYCTLSSLDSWLSGSYDSPNTDFRRKFIPSRYDRGGSKSSSSFSVVIWGRKRQICHHLQLFNPLISPSLFI